MADNVFCSRECSCPFFEVRFGVWCLLLRCLLLNKSCRRSQRRRPIEMATQIASRSTNDVLLPSSPFIDLLRRSKFATFDPTIRRVYSAPPYAERGNYGLK